MKFAEPYHGVLLSQDVLRSIGSFQDGIDGAVMSLYEAGKPLLDRLNPRDAPKTRDKTESCRKWRVDAISQLYDDVVKPWSISYSAFRLLSMAHNFQPMVELTAMLTCGTGLLDCLHDQRQLSDRTGEMLALVLSKWPWNGPTKRSRLEEMLRIRALLSPERLAWKVAMEGVAYLGCLEGVKYLYVMSPIKCGSMLRQLMDI
ncbi:unnamed protein product [Aphanomyces euteiches]|uniref:Uncharacterized protein n=1 Tax=Aphanomyces euteiches TaxID=100861 RepID=A0A6G0WY81_9STRA|nr:hypothetical protein Ae201684_010454 [Aphanomyces euteiches]KAH9089863.1 hypothetical protein Ae201684P_014618 [Aphanomyces euteiches]KAH9138597.1 hypothetical protein AeRB84_017108 [Aphanomyces euteiches]